MLNKNVKAAVANMEKQSKIKELLLTSNLRHDCHNLSLTNANLMSLTTLDELSEEVKYFLKELILWTEVINGNAKYMLQEVQAIEKGVDDE